MFGWFKRKSKRQKAKEQLNVFIDALKKTSDGKKILKKIEKKYGIKEDGAISAIQDLLDIVISVGERGKKRKRR